MFKTYREKLQEIEKFYERKDYEHVVIECAKITEQAVGYLFRCFHMTLDNTKERLKFLDFEKSNADKYSSFLNKPTIGVGIGFYDALINHFSYHKWLKPELKGSLNIINTNRNSQVHSGKATITDHDAGEVIDATEIFLKGIDLIDLPVEDIGFPLKYFLVYTSIKSKFEKGETEADFKRIINDSSKLIPDLLNTVFNKVYPFLVLDDKGRLNQLYPKTMTVENKETSIKYFIEIFNEINLFSQLDDGEALKHSLEAIVDKFKEAYTRRAVRHHVNILDIIFNFIHNKKLDHYLDYADLLKKKYLEDNQINETDRIILNDRAKELNISVKLAETIETTVVRTIEKELILFQTLHEEKTFKEVETSLDDAGAIRQISGSKSNRRLILIFGSIFVFALAIVIYLVWPKSDLTSYERAHLESKHDDVVKIIGQKRSLKDVKLNYHFIYSSLVLNDNLILKEVKSYYQELLRENPESPEALIYLGFIYNRSNIRYERDSSWFLVNKAIDMGLQSPYADFIKVHNMDYWGLPSLTQQLTDELVSNYPENPRALEIAAQTYLWTTIDTVKAIEMLEAIRTIYPDYADYYYRLGRIALNKGELETADELLKTAININDKNTNTVRAQAELYRRQSKLEEAEAILVKAIKEFGSDNKSLYWELTLIYSYQDKIEVGLKFTEEALLKFPGDWYLLYLQNELRDTQRWIEEESANKEDIQVFKWHEDFSEALSLAQKEKKPLLASFVTGSGDSFVNKRMLRFSKGDTTFLNLMSDFIPVRIKYSSDPNLFELYDLTYPRSNILVIADDKVKMEDISDRFYLFNEFTASLKDNLDKYNRYVIGKSLNSEDYTEANNFENAMIMAQAKEYVIMVVAGSEGNEFSLQLVEETLDDPVFQAEFNNLVYLNLDQHQSRKFMEKWEIRLFPSILFFDHNGILIYKTTGYKPPGLLAKITRDIKESQYNKETYDPPLNWFYSFDEVKTIAMVEKKNIFVTRSKYLNRESLLSSEVNQTLKEQFICLDISNMEYAEIRQNLGFNLYFYNSVMLNPSGNILFHSSGLSDSYELLRWLDTEEKMKMLAILGVQGYNYYQNELLLAQVLLRQELFGSAISVYSRIIDIYPESYDNYLEVAHIYLSWFRPEGAIEYFLKALEYGAPIDESLISSIVNTYLQLEEPENAINWVEQQIQINKNNPKTLCYLYLGFVELSEILQEDEKALEFADLAVQIQPKNYKSQYQFGRMLYYNNETIKALKHLNLANGFHENDPATLFYIGLCHERLENFYNRDDYFRRAHNFGFGFETVRPSFEYWFRVNSYKYPGYLKLIEQGFLYKLKVDSTDALAANNLAYFYSMEGIHLDDALSWVEISLNDDPNDYITLDTKAWILYKQEQYEEANAVMQKSIELTPEDILDRITYYHLGKIQLALGESDLAIKSLRKAYSFPEPDAEGMRLREDIEQILASQIQ